MFRVFIISLQLILLLSISIFLISNSFNVSFDIGDLSYKFSSNLLVIAFVILALIILLLNFIYFKTKFVFQKYSLTKKLTKTQKGYDLFADSMIALLNKDNKSASRSARKMKGIFKDDKILNLLLQSEIFKIEKKYDQLNEVYELMIKNSKTKTLGYRGLMEQSLKQQDYHHAFIYGEKLFLLNPNIEKLYHTLLNIIGRTKNWNQLINITDRAYSNKIIQKENANINKSIAYYEIAKIKRNSNSRESIKLIEKAIILKKNFPPYVKLYAQMLFDNKNSVKALKVIKKYWNESPSSLMRSSITEVLKENKINNLQIIQQLISKNQNNDESKKLLIDFAIYFNNWAIARENVKGLIGANPSREICLFMSEIELGEFNDIQKSESWKLRANNGKSEYYWVCKLTNNPQKNWSALSESGHFNSLEWTQPKMLSIF